MNLQFHQVSHGHGIVTIILSKSDYQEQFQEKIKHYAKNMRLKGFRTGTVPIHLVQSMYGDSMLSEILTKLASHALHEYCQKENLHVFMEPLLVEAPNLAIMQKDKEEFTFIYEIGIVEPISIDLGPHISLTQYAIEPIEDQSVDEFMQGLQLVHGQAIDLEKSTETATLYGTIQDAVSDQPISLRLVIEHIPKALQKPFVDLHVGDQIMLEKCAFESHHASLLGIVSSLFTYLKHQGHFPYPFTIHKIVQLTPAETNQSLFDTVLGTSHVDTLPAFKQALGQIIWLDKQTEANRWLDEQLKETLLGHFHILLPDALIKKWLLAKNEKNTEEEINAYADAHKMALQWEILLGQVMHKYDVVVPEQEVLERAKVIYKDHLKKKLNPEAFANYHDAAIDQEVKVFLQGENGKNYMQLHAKISKEKVLDLIKSKISIMEEAISARGFDNKRYAMD